MFNSVFLLVSLNVDPFVVPFYPLCYFLFDIFLIPVGFISSHSLWLHFPFPLLFFFFYYCFLLSLTLSVNGPFFLYKLIDNKTIFKLLKNRRRDGVLRFRTSLHNTIFDVCKKRGFLSLFFPCFVFRYRVFCCHFVSTIPV